MVPRIARRGHSFVSAGRYYLFDKNASTSQRVAWSHTLNLPTDCAHRAMRWMAFTALHAQRLKIDTRQVLTGRKATTGAVYSFSLSWHPTQNPDKNTMLQAAMGALRLLRLDEHEAVIVAHIGDTAHQHCHVICNLVHPETGIMAVPSYDRITLSNWAEKFERNDGKVLCKQRAVNNARRRREAKAGRTLGLVKHREQQAEDAAEIERLYRASDSGKAFNSALAQIGYRLCNGDRRGFVLVDGQGKINSLSRQLKKQRAKDIRQKLKNIGELPMANEIVSAVKAKKDKSRMNGQFTASSKPILQEHSNPSLVRIFKNSQASASNNQHPIPPPCFDYNV